MSKQAGTTRQFLFQLVKPYRLVIIFVIVTSLLGSGFDGISIGLLFPLLSHLQGVEGGAQLPVFFRVTLTALQPFPPGQQFFIAVGFVVIAVLLKNLFISASVRSGHWLASKLTADLRLQVMSILLKVAIDFHYRSRAGDLLDKAVNNTGQIQGYIRTIMELVANSVTFLVLIVMLLLLSWQLTLLALGLGALFLFIMLAYMKSLAKSGASLATTNKELLSTVHESLSGIQLIKSYSQERQQTRLLADKIEAVEKTEYHHNFGNFLIHPLVDTLGTIGICVLFLVALLTYRTDSRLLLAQLLPFMYVLLRIVPLAKILNAQKADLVSRWCYVSLVHELLREDNKPFIAEGNQSFGGIKREIQFSDVSFAYPAEPALVLREASFSLPAGKTTAIIGESGAGKSTLVQLLLRLYDPQRGKILIDGEPLENFQIASYHRKVGIVSQDTFLFNNTVRYNIALGAEDEPAYEGVIEAAKKAGAHDFIMTLPQGYETFVGDRGVRLSGGQRQRLAIARAILRNPEILIFDEATSALDLQTERRIHQAISDLGKDRTVVIVTHRLSSVKDADQVIRIDNGRITRVATAELSQ